MSKHKLLITTGESSGIGPEISIKSALTKDITSSLCPILIGNESIIESTLKTLKLDAQLNLISNIETDCICEHNVLNIISPKDMQDESIPGIPTISSGKASFEYIKFAVDLILKKQSNILVTAPISKESWYNAGIKYQGHTEALASLTNIQKYAMAFVNDKVKVILVTRHVALKDVVKNINSETVTEALLLGKDLLERLGNKRKNIGICSINPHVGDNGAISNEEKDFLVPFTKDISIEGLHVMTPESSDTVFYKALNKELDLVIAMYHDQGITPLKVISYNKCVNITLGLPFIRTSPGHGTALDIAGKGVADPTSMIEAVKWAKRLSNI